MLNFFDCDLVISDITFVGYVERGKGTPTHKNRSAHGISAVFSEDVKKRYEFSDGSCINVGQNDFVYMPEGSSYNVIAEISGDCYAVNFRLSGEADFPPVGAHLKNYAKYQRLFRDASVIWSRKEAGYKKRCKAMLYEMISMMEFESASGYMTRKTASLIEPAVSLIREKYTGELPSVSELAGLCGISEAYFRRIFKSVLGVSPIEYVNQQKTSYAAELLCSGLYSVSEAGELAGYPDMAYFSREFKKRYGISPRAYKQRKENKL